MVNGGYGGGDKEDCGEEEDGSEAREEDGVKDSKKGAFQIQDFWQIMIFLL